ncbi:MAG: flippase [Chitinophagaceae bacterium]
MFNVKKNKLVYNFFSLGAVQAISSLIQLIVIPHVIGKIGVDGFGVVALAQVVMFYFAVFTDYGFNQSATRDIALYKEDHKKVSEIFFRVFFSKLFLCFIAFILLFLLVLFIPIFRMHMLLYYMAFVFVVGQSVLINWFFQGLERMHFIAFATLVARVLFAILVFLFIRAKGDDFLFLFFLGGGNVIAGVISIVVAFRIYKLQFVKPSLTDIIGELKGGWQITLSHLSNSTCHYANIFILRFFVNDLVVGYYSIAERIFFTLKQVFVVFSQTAYPKVCQLVQQGKAQAVSFLKQTYSPFLLAVVLGCIILFILSPQVLYFFIGDEYNKAVFYLRVLSIAAVVVCLNIPGTLILLAMDRGKTYFNIYAIASAVNILLNIVLARFFGATGTVMTIFITEFLITMSLTRAVYREKGVKRKRADMTPGELSY